MYFLKYFESLESQSLILFRYFKTLSNTFNCLLDLLEARERGAKAAAEGVLPKKREAEGTSSEVRRRESQIHMFT